MTHANIIWDTLPIHMRIQAVLDIETERLFQKQLLSAALKIKVSFFKDKCVKF